MWFSLCVLSIYTLPKKIAPRARNRIFVFDQNQNRAALCVLRSVKSRESCINYEVILKQTRFLLMNVSLSLSI